SFFMGEDKGEGGVITIRNAIDLFMVFDSSGSMNWAASSTDSTPRIVYARQAAKNLVSKLTPQDRMFLMRFNEVVLRSWTVMDETGKANMNSSIDSITPSGGTPFYDNIGRAIREIESRTDTSRIPIIVGISDGESNSDDQWQPWMPIRMEYINNPDGAYLFRNIDGVSGHDIWNKWGGDEPYTVGWNWANAGTDYESVNGLLYYPNGPIYTILFGQEIAASHQDHMSESSPEYPNGWMGEYDPRNHPGAPNGFSTVDIAPDSATIYYNYTNSGSIEYRVWRMSNTSKGGKYFFSPTAADLDQLLSYVFEDIQQNIISKPLSRGGDDVASPVESTLPVTTESSRDVIGPQTRYMRSNTTTVNDLNTYYLGTSQSASGAYIDLGNLGNTNTNIYMGMRVYKRSSGGSETEITTSVVSIGSRTNDGLITGANWNCPRISLQRTDSLVIRIFVGTSNPPSTLVTTFTTEQLQMDELSPSTWNGYYYIDFNAQGNNEYFRFGISTYDSRITGIRLASNNTTTIPAIIQAEEYNTGGEGVGYHDSDSSNSGGQYRTDGVDIETCSDTDGGYNIGWLDDNEWLEYRINVPATGTYTLIYRVASPSGVANAGKLIIDGSDLSGSQFDCPNTGGWQTWTSVSKTVTLTGGIHIVRLYIIDNGWNINWFGFFKPPRITNTNPAGGATGVLLGASVSITFSQPMDTASVQSAFSSSPDPGGWSFSWSGGNTILTASHNNFDYQTTYTITIGATAKDLGGQFIDGNGDGNGGDPYSFSFTTELPPQYTLTININPAGAGTVTTVPSGTSFPLGTSVSLTATGGSGYIFSSWSGALSGSTNPATIVMDSDKTVTANFVQGYKLNIVISPPGTGTVQLNPPGGQYAPNTVVTATAVPYEGNGFAGWYGAASGITNPVQITMNGDKTLQANFTGGGGTGTGGWSPAQFPPTRANNSLITKEIDLDGFTSAKLTFYHKYSLRIGNNGGVILVRYYDFLANGGTGAYVYKYIKPVTTYPSSIDPTYNFYDSYNNRILWAYNGVSASGTFDWEYAEFDLTEFVGSRIQIIFLYIYVSPGNGGGWWIDDVTVTGRRADTAAVVSGVEDVWELTSTDAYSGTHCWRIKNPNDPVNNYLPGGLDASLYTRPIDLTNAETAYLEARFKFNINPEAGRPPDGFRVEVSNDNGKTWISMTYGVRAAWNVSGAEPDVSVNDPAPDGKSISGLDPDGDYWVKASTLTRLNVDLSGFRGQVIIIRFRVFTANATNPYFTNHYAKPVSQVGFGGFYLDDVFVSGTSLEPKGSRGTSAYSGYDLSSYRLSSEGPPSLNPAAYYSYLNVPLEKDPSIAPAFPAGQQRVGNLQYNNPIFEYWFGQFGRYL
ncbi:MAG: carbohydrate-binding protein, partial [Thermoplasmata archaeon]